MAEKDEIVNFAMKKKLTDSFVNGKFHESVLEKVLKWSEGSVEYTDITKLFTEVCYEIGTFRASKEEILKKTSADSINKVIQEINETIKENNRMIISAPSESQGEMDLYLVIFLENPKEELFKTLAQPEQQLFEKLVETMLIKYEYFAIPVEDCVELACKVNEQYFSSDYFVTKFIHEMIERKYLDRYCLSLKDETSRSGVIVGIRTLLELQEYLRTVYGGVILNCNHSNCTTGIMIHGWKCSNALCNYHVHHTCLKKYKWNRKCPICQCDWVFNREVCLVQRKNPFWAPTPQASSNSMEVMEVDKEPSSSTANDNVETERRKSTPNDNFQVYDNSLVEGLAHLSTREPQSKDPHKGPHTMLQRRRRGSPDSQNPSPHLIPLKKFKEGGSTGSSNIASGSTNLSKTTTAELETVYKRTKDQSQENYPFKAQFFSDDDDDDL